MSSPSPHPRIVRVQADAVVDARPGDGPAPAAILLECRSRADDAGWHTRVLAVGAAAAVDAHPAAAATDLVRVDRPGCVLMPGLVNAHTHLDLTHLGPCEHDPEAGFVAWIEMIRTGRHAAEAEIAASVRRGLDLSAAAGTVAVGDVAGAPRGRPSLAPWRAMRGAGFRGVSYLEFFGIGRTVERTRAALADTLGEAARESAGPGMRLGLQPHAPNTVSRGLYLESIAMARSATGSGGPFPLCTHLAETPEERLFVAHARGPQRDLLERLGVWDDSILADIGHGLHPVEHLRPVLERGRAEGSPLTVAHVNDADDAAIETLAATGTTVVYCPHASAYFAAERHFGPHRYLDMIEAGVNVALGTDSIVNLPAESATEGISVLREMRRLFVRDGADPRVLLGMGTLAGARALGLPEACFAFSPGQPLAGLLAVAAPAKHPSPSRRDAAAAVMESVAGPELLLADRAFGVVGTLAERVS